MYARAYVPVRTAGYTPGMRIKRLIPRLNLTDSVEESLSAPW